jgi:hypothetical protein
MKLADLIRLCQSDALRYHPRITIEWKHLRDAEPQEASLLEGSINRPFNDYNDWLPAVFFTMQADGTITSIEPSGMYRDDALTAAINKLGKV